MKWLKRWHKIGYRKLWYLHFGGYHEGDKGCKRDYDFMVEIFSGWRDAYVTEKGLRVEAERLLTENGIESPTEKRSRLLKERYPRGV